MFTKFAFLAASTAGLMLCQEQLASLKGHSKDINVVACSPIAPMFVSGGGDEKTVLWDVATKQQIGEAPAGGSVMSLAVSPNGARIAAGENYHKIKLLDATGKEIKTLEGHEASVIAVGFTPASDRLISFSSDGAMRFWDANTGAAQGESATARDAYWAGAFSRDGRWFASGTQGGTIYVFNLTTKKMGIKITAGPAVKALAFSPDGKMIAAALNDSTVRLFSAADGKLVYSLPQVDGNAIAYSPDGTRIAVAGHDNEVKLIDASSLQLIASLKGHERTVRSVCFLSDGNALVSGSFDMTVRIWPVQY